ncbi:MAG: hypothetical protein R2874_01505 [Desulfobacterales bacterium]
MKPEFVSPLVLLLCSKECQENGNIYNAGMGFFNRVAVVTGFGTTVGDGENPRILKQWWITRMPSVHLKRKSLF